MPRVRIAAADYGGLRGAAIRAEHAGVDIVFNLDHIFSYSGEPTGKHFEALTMLASLAEVTERVELGSLVTGIGYANPNLLTRARRTGVGPSGPVAARGAGWGAGRREGPGHHPQTP